MIRNADELGKKMPFNPLTIRLHSADNVVVARIDLTSGAVIPEEEVTCLGSIAFGHKIATSFSRAGDSGKKYGQIIGFASLDIQPGEHVHTHNLSVIEFTRDYAMGEEATSDAITTTDPQAAIESGIDKIRKMLPEACRVGLNAGWCR